MGVWLAAVLVPSLLGGGACLSHVVGGDDASASHASHAPTVAAQDVGDSHAGHTPHVADAKHAAHAVAHTTVDAAATEASITIDESTPHDCCPQQGAPEHCSGASGCTAAVNSVSTRAPSAFLVVAELNRATSPVAPPGPANAPDVPPPRA